jgi:hypothetical protein
VEESLKCKLFQSIPDSVFMDSLFEIGHDHDWEAVEPETWGDNGVHCGCDLSNNECGLVPLVRVVRGQDGEVERSKGDKVAPVGVEETVPDY